MLELMETGVASRAAATRTGPERPLLVYFGHHKCASTYILQFLERLNLTLGLQMRAMSWPQSLPLDYHKKEPRFQGRLQETLDAVREPNCELLCLYNAERVYLDLLANRPFRAFHVIRDPRDIIVSGYFSHRNSHPADPNLNPWLVEHRARLRECDQEDGLVLELEYSSAYLEHMRGWNYRHPDVLESRFETLTVEPAREFARILRFLGIALEPNQAVRRLWRRLAEWSSRYITRAPLPHTYCREAEIAEILEAMSFKRLSKGREIGKEDAGSHYRKGIAGDWVNYFTPRVKKIFKNRFGDLLLQLGYESSDDW